MSEERTGKSPRPERRKPGKKNRHVSKNTITRNRTLSHSIENKVVSK
jgi:hypothetical protein